MLKMDGMIDRLIEQSETSVLSTIAALSAFPWQPWMILEKCCRQRHICLDAIHSCFSITGSYQLTKVVGPVCIPGVYISAAYCLAKIVGSPMCIWGAVPAPVHTPCAT